VSKGIAANMKNSTITDRPFHQSDSTTKPHSNRKEPSGSILISEQCETNFYALFESINDATFLLEGDNVIDCNNRTLELFVCSRQQIVNQPLLKFSPLKQPDSSDSREGLKQKINLALKGESQFFEWKLARSNSNLFDAEVSFNCVELKGKRLLHCIVRDVTERKREEELYKTLATSSPVGIYIIRDGKFRFVNPKFQEFVGYSAQELMSITSTSLIHPDDRETARANAIKMLKMQRTTPYEFRIVTKTGQIKWTMETVIPIFYDGKREILGNYMDIDDRKKAEEALKASEERYRTILENIEDGYYELDLKGNFTFFNESCRKIIGYSRNELMGMNHRQYVDKETTEKLFKLAAKVHQTGLPKKSSDLEIIRKDGFKRHIEISISLMKDISGNPIGFRGIVRDIDDRKKAEATILHMAHHDALTGLPNRLLFNDRLKVAIFSAQRNNKKFAVMMLDLDKFKDVNDSYGHDIGDQLLQSIGNRLRGHLRKSDTVARMGGDEFMLLLPEIDQVEYSKIIAKKIIDSFQRPFSLGKHDLKITTSIGIAVYPDSGSDFDTLKKNADIAMYKAKESGRNNFQSYGMLVGAKKIDQPR
jgi:diguanylate cyclase (GGDEF)-like protein/PAS domain S-box-containing protein